MSRSLVRDPRAVAATVVLGAMVMARRTYLRWGATSLEQRAAQPGDELLPRADLTATRAITIHAGPEQVWPWLAQLGQGRGGFYTYDLLENLVGLDMHSADRIVERWQDLAVGDEVRLHPEGGMVARVVNPDRALVLQGGMPTGAGVEPFDFTWAFALDRTPDGSTRLVVRERYAYLRWWAILVVEPVEVISFIMSRRMLRGIKARAERSARPSRLISSSVSGLSQPSARH